MAKAARVHQAKMAAVKSFVCAKKKSQKILLALQQGLEVDGDLKNEDIFQLQLHHMLTCLERTTDREFVDTAYVASHERGGYHKVARSLTLDLPRKSITNNDVVQPLDCHVTSYPPNDVGLTSQLTRSLSSLATDRGGRRSDVERDVERDGEGCCFAPDCCGRRHRQQPMSSNNRSLHATTSGLDGSSSTPERNRSSPTRLPQPPPPSYNSPSNTTYNPRTYRALTLSERRRSSGCNGEDECCERTPDCSTSNAAMDTDVTSSNKYA